MGIEAQGLNLAYGQTVVVRELNLSIPVGKITAIVGRNGSGKSTILKAFARLLSPQRGAVYLDGQAIHRMPPKEVARQLAILPQNPLGSEGLTVEQLAWYGRHPYQGMLGLRTREDRRLVDWALEVTGMAELADRPLTSLSGGQRQRAWIATSLAQDARFLLLDEPTTYLDIAYQLEVLELLERLNRETDRTIVMVVHDLNHGVRYADHLVVVDGGAVVAAGTPVDTLTEALVEQAFDVRCRIFCDPSSGRPLCVPQCLARPDNRPPKAGGDASRPVDLSSPDAYQRV